MVESGELCGGGGRSAAAGNVVPLPPPANGEPIAKLLPAQLAHKPRRKYLIDYSQLGIYPSSI